jgi:hypothetical protein
MQASGLVTGQIHHDGDRSIDARSATVASWVGLWRPVTVARGGFPQPARRTRRAIFIAPGSLRVVAVGQPVAASGLGVHGVGMR